MVTDTQQKLADAQGVVTRRQRADVRDAKEDRHQSLRRLCCGASKNAASIKDGLRTRRPDAPAKGEGGYNSPSGSASKSKSDVS